MTNEYNESYIKDYASKNLSLDGKIYLLGGTGVVSQRLENDLLKKHDVIRLGGIDRYETNLEILKEAGVKGEEILVCSAFEFADSLSASAVGKPILLVGKAVSPEQLKLIGSVDTPKSYMIGGTGAVNDSIKNMIGKITDTERIGGANRYETSCNIARKFFYGPHDDIVLASGDNFPDGLVGGPLGIAVDGPLLLINSRNTTGAADYVNVSGTDRCLLLGGNTLISDDMVDRVME